MTGLQSKVFPVIEFSASAWLTYGTSYIEQLIFSFPMQKLPYETQLDIENWNGDRNFRLKFLSPTEFFCFELTSV